MMSLYLFGVCAILVLWVFCLASTGMDYYDYRRAPDARTFVYVLVGGPFVAALWPLVLVGVLLFTGGKAIRDGWFSE